MNLGDNMGDKVVISGISGTFPNATNVSSFRDNLLNKVDMVSADNRRWKRISFLPARSGDILDAEKFDLGYFGVTSIQSDYMDPMVRKVLEKATEAIMDAGYHPSDLEDTNTAVIGGYICGDNEQKVLYGNHIPVTDSMTGNQRSMLSKRISYHLKLNGQVYATDAACSTSMYALEHAYTMIKNGLCDKALVSGSNLCLSPMVTIQYSRLGVLSPDGVCRTFDDDAQGYMRSDAVVTILLERRRDAKRIYAEVIHVKTSCDGFKNEGITHPMSDLQQVLLREFYDECKVDPNSLSFVEAHGTGTQVGDPEELRAIDSVFCKGRDKPLHIGSVKSNIGHTEAASALCSIIKAIMSMETGYILPNIHYKTPRKGAEGLEQGRMVVTTEKLPLPDKRGLFAIDSFGIGGANAHTLLFWNTKLKINDGQPNDDLPRLLCVSSRTAEGVNVILDDFKEYDAEYAYLIHQVFRKPFENHLYRGFGVYSKEGELKRSLVKVGMKEKKLYLVFSNFDKEFLKLASEFMELPTFARSIESIHNVLLKSAGINFLEIMKNHTEENFVNQILISAAMQIGLTNILKEINLIPYRTVGVDSGVVVAAYADDFMTLEQTILTIFYIASDANNSNNNNEQILDDIMCWRMNNNAEWIPSHQQETGQSLAKYFTNNIVSSTNEWNFKNLLTKDAVPIIIGTGVENMSEIKNMYLVDPNSKDFIQDFLTTLGSLYEYGFDMQLDKLYPTIELPVGRGTPTLSPLIKWNYLRDCTVHEFEDEEETKHGHRTVYIFSKVAEWSFIIGHLIDGRHLFPATGFLYLVWETFAKMTGKIISEMKIVFEDLRFIRAANLPNDNPLVLKIMIRTSSRTFKILEGEDTIVTGKIYEKSDEHAFSNLTGQAFKDEDLCLNQTDVYKELNLRGYSYSGLFRNIQRSNPDASKVIIQWNGNWIAFMDCLLQVILLQEDYRDMYLPTFIHQLVIDAPKFLNLVACQSLVHVESHRRQRTLKTEGIELRSLTSTFTQRKKPGNPVLEVHKFIANESECTAEDSIKVLMQFVLENSDTLKFKVVEVCPEGMGQDKVLSPLIQKVLEGMPLVQEELLVLSSKSMELLNIPVRKQPLNTIINCFILVVANLLESNELLHALDAVKGTKGFIISREILSTDLSKFNDTTLKVLCSYKTNEEILVLLKPIQSSSKDVLTIDITNSIEDLQWIPKLQDLLMKNDRIIIYTQADETSGILGLVNCLRKEHYGGKLRAVFIMDEAPKFDPKLDFYKKQLDKNLLINVWKDGTWGTYKHLQLPQTQTVQKEHCYATITRRGDLSSMTWIEGNLNADDLVIPEKELIHIYYSALNSRDLMIASGKIPPDVVTKNRIEQECFQGFEFSGRDAKGRRVMGMCQKGSLATLIQCDKDFIFPIPDDWTMEEAATVPVAYATVIHAFNSISQLKSGQSILIHSGTDGVPQAAINLSLHFGLTVFVTVESQEKGDLIKQHYPQIEEEHIGNSRDTTFETMIRRHTNGRGVNYILNSLEEEKFLASVRCLAKGGVLIEIGKFDLVNNNELALYLLEKGIDFIGFGIDRFITRANCSEKKALFDQFMDYFKRGIIKPLPRTVFSTDEVDKAFRYMGQEKHIGKILVKIRDEEERKQYPVSKLLFKGLPRFYCKSTGSYLLHGGLGGFGLELADFLVVRGARKLVLTSRSGITNGYQQYRMRIWKSYGVEVLIRICDEFTEESCIELLNAANELGTLDGIFNLAVILKDAAFDNQSIDDFKKIFSPKVPSTKHLDKISRKLCPNLRYFVVFSSLACGRGNAGQTSYGMANSIMERICEKRKREGYPALAVQWGAIGDVGTLVKAEDGDNDRVIVGLRQQRIFSCLQVLDTFLTQKETIVSSMLVAETKHGKEASNSVDAILNIIGISNINTVSMYSTLPELGMDSIMAIEVKQTLEREYQIFLTRQEIKQMTIKKLKNLSDAQKSETTTKGDSETDIPLNIQLLFPNIGSGENADVPVLKMKTSVGDDENAPHIFALPGLDGTSTSLEPLCRKLKAHVFCLQFSLGHKRKSLSEIAESFLPHIVSFNGDLIILAYSFGCIIATELLYLLAMKGRRANVIYLDGSADLIRDFMMQYLPFDDENLFQMKFLMLSMASYMTHEQIMTHKNNILQYKDFEEKLDYVIGLLEEGELSQYFKEACVSIYNRIMGSCEYKPKMGKLKFPITLFKPTKTILKGISPDYNLSSLFEKQIDICSVEGTHVSMLNSDDLAVEINKICRRD